MASVYNLRIAFCWETSIRKLMNLSVIYFSCSINEILLMEKNNVFSLQLELCPGYFLSLFSDKLINKYFREIFTPEIFEEIN